MEKAMAIAELSPARYGKLLSATLPKVIETRAEFDRAVALMEELDRREVRGDSLSREELALRELLEQLVEVYDDRIELPKTPPDRMIRYLMEQRGLKQADLLPKRFMFSLADGRVMFLAPDVGGKIEALGINVRENFTITRKWDEQQGLSRNMGSRTRSCRRRAPLVGRGNRPHRVLSDHATGVLAIDDDRRGHGR
jgi:antitoxin component HigA of HigAB toxin-antitoxin module